MVDVLAPRPGGALASIAATPHTDILLVAHAGLEQLDSLADLWRGLPLTHRVRVGWWLEPEEDLPAGHDERIRWLYDRWADMDRWIAANRAPDRVAACAVGGAGSVVLVPPPHASLALAGAAVPVARDPRRVSPKSG